LEVDETLLETLAANKRNPHDVRRARSELAKLLSEPMQAQRYGKFLSTNSPRTLVPTTGLPASLNVHSRKRRRKRS
jgi:hypothetical protein